jgi:hypothetical protein
VKTEGRRQEQETGADGSQDKRQIRRVNEGSQEVTSFLAAFINFTSELLFWLPSVPAFCSYLLPLPSASYGFGVVPSAPTLRSEGRRFEGFGLSGEVCVWTIFQSVPTFW